MARPSGAGAREVAEACGIPDFAINFLAAERDAAPVLRLLDPGPRRINGQRVATKVISIDSISR